MFLHTVVKAVGLKKFFFSEEVKEFSAIALPDCGTLNIGDEIIADAVMKQMASVLKEELLMRFPTQTSYSTKCLNFYNMAHLRIIGGSNLMSSTVLPVYNQWDVPITGFWKYKPAVLMGVGWKKYQKAPGLFAKLFYNSLLSRDYIHSVRDSYTEQQLRALGFSNVLNTACPTTWELTPEHCAAIPQERSESAVITITDYAHDLEMSRHMIETVRLFYKKIYFFAQGVKDLEYLKNTVDPHSIHVIQPTLKAYDDLLETEHPDFIGTRLHGGIRALQHSCRALIVAIDNRAAELSKDIKLPVVVMDSQEALSTALKNGWKIALELPQENINKWKEQFKKA